MFYSVPLQPIQWNTRLNPSGRYSVFTVATAEVNVLTAGSLIHCEMRIPGTGYVKRKALLYYPAGKQINYAQNLLL